MKKFLKKLHLYLAIIFCIPLILQGLSGAIIVFEREVLENKNYIPAVGEKQKTSAAILAVQQKIPAEFNPAVVKFSEITTIRFAKKTAEKSSILEAKIDPVSLEILEIKDPQTTFFYNLEKFHTNLLIQGNTGRNIVGIYGIIMLFMTISGIILWWPRKGNLKRSVTFKFSSIGKKFHRDLHAAIGFWFASILLISSFGGIYLAFPKETSSVILSVFDGQNFREISDKIKVDENLAGASKYSIDEIIELTKNPEEKLISINFPTKKDQPFRLNFVPKNYSFGQPAGVIYFDHTQNKIIQKLDPNSYSLGEKIIAWLKPLHLGLGLGTAWKIAIFLAGFLPLLFSITGIAMWLKKSAKKI